MVLNLFGNKNDALEFRHGPVAKMIQNLRAIHLTEGGDPKDFPEYLRKAGVQMIGPVLKVEGEFETMARLKYQK